MTIDVKTLIGTTRWRVQPFSGREHHYIAFVYYARKSMNDPSAAPDVLIFPSVELKAFVDRQKSPTLNVQTVARHLGVSDSWQQLLVKAA